MRVGGSYLLPPRFHICREERGDCRGGRGASINRARPERINGRTDLQVLRVLHLGDGLQRLLRAAARVLLPEHPDPREPAGDAAGAARGGDVVEPA